MAINRRGRKCCCLGQVAASVDEVAQRAKIPLQANNQPEDMLLSPTPGSTRRSCHLFADYVVASLQKSSSDHGPSKEFALAGCSCLAENFRPRDRGLPNEESLVC